MSILVNAQSRVLVQSLTGCEGRQFHAEQMLKYGIQIMAGVTVIKELGHFGTNRQGSIVRNVCFRKSTRCIVASL